MYITLVRINDFMDFESFTIGQELLLEKDIDNRYDDESIKVKTISGATCGFVANSVCTVARGTHSAGYIYNSIKEKQKCIVKFITNYEIIAEII